MKYIVAARSLQIATGVLTLSPAQAGPRMHNLNDLKGGRYEVLKPVEFKQGEEIGYEGDLPKALAMQLDTEEVAKAKAGKKAAQKSAAAPAKEAAKE